MPTYRQKPAVQLCTCVCSTAMWTRQCSLFKVVLSFTACGKRYVSRKFFMSALIFGFVQPKKWVAFWESKEEQVLALDMVENQVDLDRILSAVSRQQQHAPARRCCMECKAALRSFSRTVHCGHCARLLCKKCASSCRREDFFPKYCKVTEPSWACSACERILISQKEGMSIAATHPTSSYGEEDCYSC